MSIDVLSAASHKPIAAQAVPSKNSDSSDVSFGQLLSNALEDVNKVQLNAKQASVDLAAGKIQDVSEAVIATEKASIALQLTMQVRNKVVDAYQEIMRMQV